MAPDPATHPLTVPELTLAAAQLRSWNLSDASRLVDAWCDPAIARWNSVPPEPTLQTAQRWIAGETQRLDQRLSVDVVIDTTSHGVVGEVGLSGFSPNHRGALIGYWLLPQGRGFGLASTAVAAVATWAHQVLDLEVIVARCHESNEASQSVASRAGFTQEGSDGTGHQLWRSRPS